MRHILIYSSNRLFTKLKRHGMMIPIDRTIVSRTTCADILRMYKKFRPMFDEVFFVISNSGNDPENRFSNELCEYSNGKPRQFVHPIQFIESLTSS